MTESAKKRPKWQKNATCLFPLTFQLPSFEAAQSLYQILAKPQTKLFSWCLQVPESTFVFAISYGYFNKKCQNYSEEWHFLTSFGYHLSFHFLPFGFEATLRSLKNPAAQTKRGQFTNQRSVNHETKLSSHNFSRKMNVGFLISKFTTSRLIQRESLSSFCKKIDSLFY